MQLISLHRLEAYATGRLKNWFIKRSARNDNLAISTTDILRYESA
jgi:hypothetical protein